MKKFGLIGYPLSHSFSQKYFSEKFNNEGITDCEYSNYALESIELLPNLIKNNKELVGLNVTIPYKEQVIPYLDEIDASAKEIGAVNTIKITRIGENYKLKGYNSDVYGFRKPLEEHINEKHKKALILGTGGASKAVAWVLKNLDISYSFVSRTPKAEHDFAYEDLTGEIIAEHNLIVNTSPIGMYPNVKQAPNLPYCSITSNHILYDLVYNPEKTRFLKKGASKKATLLNGLPMLFLQAEKSWEIWGA